MAPSLERLREDNTPLLVDRARAGLRLCLTSISLFAIADQFVYPDLVPRLYALKAVQVGTALAAFVALRGRPTRRRTVVTAATTVSILCVTSAWSGVVTDDAGTTPVLLVVLAMGAATLLPWGMGPQVVVLAVAIASTLWNQWAVIGYLDLTGMPVALVMGSIAALYAAYASERYHLERRRAEEAEAEVRARQHQAELAQAARLSTLGGMAAGLAHEINQPLAAIVSYARGCARRIQVGETHVEALLEVVDEISTQALRAGEVLRRIREFVRHTQLPRIRVDLNALAREALHFAAMEANELGIVLVLDLADEPLDVEADGIQIEQVMLNLVRNGFEAMAHTDGERQLRIQTRTTEDGTAEFAVHDTGEGVSASIAGRLFDPFFTTRRDGLGLGLAISRSIVEAHGGRLWTTPNHPRGSTFRFTLPAVSGDAKDAA
jgi:signal transduction histidine kinase